MPGKVDLHMHSYHSDGFNSPRDLVVRAKDVGLEIISLTDHDNLNGMEEAAAAGQEFGIEVIPGVEISSDISNRELHILGYFVDPSNKEFLRYLNFFREERIKRAELMVKKLRLSGINITIEDVIEKAKNSAVGRPHIAQVLLDKGFISNFYEAFNKFIGNDCPAYEKKIHISPESAFKIINDAGGLSFIAHPGYIPEALLKEAIEAGVDGIEVIHPSHSYQQTKFYRGIVNEYFLLESGGSDYHGGKREDDQNYGKYYCNTSIVDAMRRRLLKNSA